MVALRLWFGPPDIALAVVLDVAWQRPLYVCETQLCECVNVRSQSGGMRWVSRTATRRGHWTCALTIAAATATSSNNIVDGRDHNIPAQSD